MAIAPYIVFNILEGPLKANFGGNFGLMIILSSARQLAI
jgi:hypothetical protein